MRLLLLLLLTGPALAPAQTRQERGRPSRVGRAAPALPPPAFEFLPASGAGVATAADFCASLASADRVGSWWCLNGDSTMASGSAVTLAPVGSPTVASRPICNSGLNCTERAVTYLKGTAAQYFSTASNVAAPVASFTVCAAYATDGAGDDIINFGDGAGDYTFLMEDNGTTGITTYCDGVPAGACGAGPTSYVPIAGQPMFQCGIFEASTSTRTHGWSAAGYLSNSTGVHTKTQVDQAARKWSIGRSFAGTDPYATGGYIIGAFMTEKVLTIDQMRTIGAAIFPGMNYLNTALRSPTGAKGEVLTFTRAASPRSCCQNNDVTGTTCTMLGPAAPCVSGGVLWTWPEGINRQFYGRQINVAPWSDFAGGGAAAPTLNAANVATPDPFGMPSAEDYTFPATTATQYSTRLGNAGVAACTGVACANQVKVYGVGNSGTTDVCAVGATVSCADCTVTSGVWTFCYVVANLAGNPSIAVGNASLYNGGVARDSLRVLVSSAQTEVGSDPSPYADTLGTTLTRVAETAGFVGADAVAVNGAIRYSGCAAATIISNRAAGLVGGIVHRGDTGRYLYSASTDTLVRIFDGTNVQSDTATGYVAGTPLRVWSSWSAPALSMSVSGTDPATTSVYDGDFQVALGIAIGSAPAGFGGPGASGGGVGRVVLDPTPSRCR